MVDPRPNDADQLLTNVDHLQTQTLIVPTIPLLRAVFHLHHVVGCQGQSLEATTSSYSPRGDEVVQRQRVEGPESTSRTLHSLIDRFGRRIDPVGIIMSGLSILDVVLRLELFETLRAGIVNILGVGNELGRRRRSVGSGHFEWRTG